MSNPVRDARWKAYVGGRVSVEGKGKGVLLYYGATAKSKGMKKCGIALDSSENGKHNVRLGGFRRTRGARKHRRPRMPTARQVRSISKSLTPPSFNILSLKGHGEW